MNESGIGIFHNIYNQFQLWDLATGLVLCVQIVWVLDGSCYISVYGDGK